MFLYFITILTLLTKEAMFYLACCSGDFFSLKTSFSECTIIFTMYWANMVVVYTRPVWLIICHKSGAKAGANLIP